jgi:non-specific protein-tyrosine kinase
MELNLEYALRRAKADQKKAGRSLKVAAATTRSRTASGSTPVPTDSWQAPIYSQSRALPMNLATAEANHCVCALPDRPESDYYRVLRTQIQHISAQRDLRSIMVTSTNPGEGKTVTSINLAFAFAKAYHQTVLLVDCDFRQQSIQNYLGLNSNLGLVEILLEGRPLGDALIWPGVDKLSLISGSRTIVDSSDLMASPMMTAQVKEMRNRYADRFLFFDTPPILGCADAVAFAPAVDGVLLVVGSEGSAKKEIQQAMELIPADKFIGVVLNNYSGRMPSYHMRN